MLYVCIQDEGAGPYLSMSTSGFTDATDSMETIYLESESDIDELAHALKQTLKDAGESLYQ